MSLPRYPRYKPSDVEWLGEVPEHWDVVPLRFLVDCLDGIRVPLNAEQRAARKGAVPYWGANCVVDYVDKALVSDEVVLLGEDGAPFFDRSRPVAFFVNEPIWPNNHVHVLRPCGRVLGEFITHVLNITDYADFIQGSTRDKLTQAAMNGIPVLAPTNAEQVAITTFLDRETAKIDALVAEQERLIELLKEKRQAVISHAVTKGLDPSVQMKDSGIEWMEKVPAHWGVARLKDALQCRITDGPHTTPEFTDDGVPFLSVDGIQDGELVFSGCRFVSVAAHEEFRRKALPRRNDILMGKAASTGKIARVKVDFEFSIWSPLALIKIDGARFDPQFVEYSLKSAHSQSQVDILCTSNTQKNISMEDIPRLALLCPPIDEQRAVAARLESETTRIDSLVSEASGAAQLMRERRAALISAAVTGQIDVRDAVHVEVA